MRESSNELQINRVMLGGGGKRQSEHENIYARLKLDKQSARKKSELEEQQEESDPIPSGDPYQSIKEGINIDPRYELYLQTEKLTYLSRKKFRADPMEIVADKIRKAEDLDDSDLRTWVQYNYLAFPLEEQERVKALFDRQTWFWRRTAFILPPLFYMSYAVLSFQLKKRLLPNLVISGVVCYAFTQLGLWSSNRDMWQLNNRLYDQYKDEVTLPKYRGLKLTKNKRVYQIDHKQFTSSNLDDLKQLINSQRK